MQCISNLAIDQKDSMNLGPLFVKLALLKEQRHSKPCKRCGLLHDQRVNECPHCGSLSDRELAKMLEEKELEHLGNVVLGNKLFIFAGIIAILLIIMLASS